MDFVKIVVKVGMKEKGRANVYFVEHQLVKEIGVVRLLKL